MTLTLLLLFLASVIKFWQCLKFKTNQAFNLRRVNAMFRYLSNDPPRCQCHLIYYLLQFTSSNKWIYFIYSSRPCSCLLWKETKGLNSLRDTSIWATITTSMCYVQVTWFSFLRLINFTNYGFIPAAECIGDLVKSAVDNSFPFYSHTTSVWKY